MVFGYVNKIKTLLTLWAWLSGQGRGVVTARSQVRVPARTNFFLNFLKFFFSLLITFNDSNAK